MVSKKTMLRALLNERFFNACLVHEEDKNNEENSFCMDCCFSLCYNCLPHHQSHRIIKIRRYMYKSVLRLKDAQKIFNCSLIQSFTTNSEKVILLRPRQCDETFIHRGSRCTCLVCKQNIRPSSVFCSMLCKFSNQNMVRNLLVSGSFGSVPESPVSLESSVEDNSSIATSGDVTNYETIPVVQGVDHPEHKRSISTPSKGSNRKLHGRNSIPQRSPLF